MTDQFDAQIGDMLSSAREVMPEGSALLLERKLLQIHAKRPDLTAPEVLRMAFDVLDGEEVDARIGLDETSARAREAAVEDARIESMKRIAAVSGDLDALEAQFPGRETLAEALAAVGASWADLGLSEDDAALAEEIRRDMRQGGSGLLP